MYRRERRATLVNGIAAMAAVYVLWAAVLSITGESAASWRAQILAVVSKWLDAYAWLEAALNDRPSFPFEEASSGGGSPAEIARVARLAGGSNPNNRCATSAGCWKTTASSSCFWSHP